jgi:hypothetical protein
MVNGKPPRAAIMAGAGAAVLLAAWALLSGGGPGPSAPVRAGERRAGPGAGSEPAVPVIGFDRVARAQPEAAPGGRDLFDFGVPPAPPVPVTEATPPPVFSPPPVTAATPPPLPPLNIKYIGAVKRRGVEVAMLMTDRNEVLTGQVGDVVGNRVRIVKIGLESVDVQEVGSDQVRRIPLKGN